MPCLAAGDEQQPRGVTVETVDDARAGRVRTGCGEPRGPQGVDERVAPVAGARMDDQPRGLGEDGEVVVAVSDRRQRRRHGSCLVSGLDDDSLAR